ncbi:polynucleotide adenylyltransferase PcnB [Pontibacter sp. JAM-7]|uniref:polynucleotide adenylyltransferase PcnB n=1 Tax=Pontibacter sp. JAM-7 TaxID=3366581 RepID=UPI003AF5487F
MGRSLFQHIISRLLGLLGITIQEPPAEQADIIFSKRIIPEAEHRIPRRLLDDNALKVAYRLQDSGYEGYLVGGCIRDLLLSKVPKDFDVATDAHPEEAAELFRRSRLIGRRFKLVHVRFGRDLVEVATFRTSHDNQVKQDDQAGRQCDSGMILRDNVYGTIEDDARRRDFTVNALYYCPKDHCVYDFANGYQDLQQRRLRIMGTASDRYREDPVRMLRAARFAAKLDFTIEPASEKPIFELGQHLSKIAPARLFDETLKLFQSGHAVASFTELRRLDLFRYLFPQVEPLLEQDIPEMPVDTLVLNALNNTDRRLAQNKSVTPAFLFAALLWYPTKQLMEKLIREQNMPQLPALHEAANQVLAAQVRTTAIPRRFSTPLREIWELQLRLTRRSEKSAARTFEHPRFRAAYDLLLLRENSGEALDGLSQWWTDYQTANPDQRHSMSQQPATAERPKRRRRRRAPSNRAND